MPKLHWVIWLLIILVVIGLAPGLYHWVVTSVSSGIQTVCHQCTTGGG